MRGLGRVHCQGEGSEGGLGVGEQRCRVELPACSCVLPACARVGVHAVLVPGRERGSRASVVLGSTLLGGACLAHLKSALTSLQPVSAGAGGWSNSQSPIDAVTAALETVLYAQMLVLFAPHAVPAKSHVQASRGHCTCRMSMLQHFALQYYLNRNCSHVALLQVRPAERKQCRRC